MASPGQTTTDSLTAPPPPPVLAKVSSGPRLPMYTWAALSLILLLLYNLIFSPGFFKIDLAQGRLVGNPINVLHYGSTVMLISLGMTLVIATGGIDLSVGAIMAIVGGITALMITGNNALWLVCLAIVVGLGAGFLAGFWNGFLIGYVKIQPIITTLILMISGRGLAICLTGGKAPTISADSPFVQIAQGTILGVPVTIYIVLIMSVLTILLVRRTALGMFFESIGNNRATCEVVGINTRFFTLMAYAFIGVCSAIAGIIDAAMNRVGDTNQSGLNIELDAIVAVAIGGTSLIGGRFSLVGSLLGALTMQTLMITIQSTSWIKPEYNLVVKAFVVIIICLLQSPKIRSQFAKLKKSA